MRQIAQARPTGSRARRKHRARKQQAQTGVQAGANGGAKKNPGDWKRKYCGARAVRPAAAERALYVQSAMGEGKRTSVLILDAWRSFGIAEGARGRLESRE